MNLRFQLPTENQREALLKLEAQAILHDLSKFSETHIRNRTDALFSASGEGGGLEYDRRSIAVGELRGQIHNPRGFIWKLHGFAHYEKQDVAKNNQQQYPYVYGASPFGFETRLPVPMPPEWIADPPRPSPLERLETIATPDRQQLLADLKTYLQQGIADTRRAINDVSLWDWGFIVATLAKPAAYTILQAGMPPDLAQLEVQTLAVHVDRLALYARSDKISDLLGVRQALDDAYGRIRTLLEETYVIGNRFYHDESGDYYLLPVLEAAGVAALRELIQNEFPLDLKPDVMFGAPVTLAQIDPANGRNLNLRDNLQTLFTRPRLEALEASGAHAPGALRRLNAIWQNERRPAQEICTVCGLRPVGYPAAETQVEAELLRRYGDGRSNRWASVDKAEARNVCRECLVRRSRRSERWLTEPETTIWTDEVADENGRLALFVGTLGLESWLDGSLLDTLRADRTRPLPQGSKNASPARLYHIAETARDFWTKVTQERAPAVVTTPPPRLAIRPGNKDLNLGHGHTYELLIDGLPLSVVWDDRGQGRFVSADNLTYFEKLLNAEQPLLGRLQQHQGQRLVVREPAGFLKTDKRLGEIRVAGVDLLESYSPAIALLNEPSLCLLLLPAANALDFARAVKGRYLREMGRVVDRLPLNIGLVFFKRRTPITAVLDAGQRMLGMARSWEPYQVTDHTGYALTLAHAAGRSFTHTYPERMGAPKEAHLPVLPTDGWYPYLLSGNPAQASAELLSIHVSDLRIGDTVWARLGSFDFEFLDTASRRFTLAYDGAARQRPDRPTRPFLLADIERFEDIWKRFARLATSQRHQVVRTIEATREDWFGPVPDFALLTEGDLATFRQFVADTLAGAAWPKERPWRQIAPADREALIHAGFTGELADLAELHMEIMKTK
jgi:hypothetical protein